MEGSTVLEQRVAPRFLPLAAVFAKSGVAASVNDEAFAGIRFAISEIIIGGIRGHLPQLHEYDNRSTALGSRQAGEEVLASDALAVIGSAWSSHSLALAPVCRRPVSP